MKEFRAKHAERLQQENIERSKKYRKEHPEKAAAAIRRWRVNNRERYLENQRRYLKNNLPKANVRWHKRHAKVKANGGSFSLQEWEALKAEYSYCCLRCGAHESEKPLTVDHVIPISAGGMNTIDNIQPLCGLCNSSKGAKHIDYRNVQNKAA